MNLGAAGPYGLGIGFQIFYGNGDGTFQAPISYSQPQRAARVLAGPLYPGGPPAIVITTASSSYAWIFANDGKGNFSAPHYAYLPGDDGLTLGDMDNDGYADLISSLGYVAYGAAGTTFPSTKYYPVFAPGSSQYTAAVGDLTNNRKLDIVTDSNFGISVVFNKGQRQFQEGNWTAVTGGADCAASGDFNRDGRTDLALINASGVSILLGTGSVVHPWKFGATLAIANPGSPVVGDLNGDGVPDLLVPTPSGAVTFLGKGDGTFTETSITLTSAEGYLVLGDFNHDGKLDFATSANLLAYTARSEWPKRLSPILPMGGFPTSPWVT